MRSITLLGSTGSVGCSTLDLVSRARDRFRLEALTAGSNVDLLVEQALAFRPAVAVIADESRYQILKDRLAGSGIEAAAGSGAVIEAAQRPSDLTMAGIVGAAGLPPTLAAIRRGTSVAFANKEVLVTAGPVVMAEIERCGATLLPVDSEHNAIFQVFDEAQRDRIERIILTASGGPFRRNSMAEMARMTPAQAVNHPIWSMGAKISIDSATMMNKGLELIEAYYLFRMPEDKIEILVHPQSVIHSMVAYCDGSVLAQLGSPDMRTPIAYALAYPDRMPAPSPRLDLATIGQLTFEEPDPVRFPALRLAREALSAGGAAPAVLNAANEVAVENFLKSRIGFLDIARLVEEAMVALLPASVETLDDVLAIDEAARRFVADAIISTSSAA
ncbi:MAG: 1-deoxy-D-xylulose-5-phosphate reductoisomerase [Elsteraceae bacterium]